jgi:hypothetical protein
MARSRQKARKRRISTALATFALLAGAGPAAALGEPEVDSQGQIKTAPRSHPVAAASELQAPVQASAELDPRRSPEARVRSLAEAETEAQAYVDSQLPPLNVSHLYFTQPLRVAPPTLLSSFKPNPRVTGFRSRNIALLRYSTPFQLGQNDLVFNFRAPGSRQSFFTCEFKFYSSKTLF